MFWCFTIVLNEFEVTIGTMSNFFEIIYNLVITMLTIGYGDITVKSLFGQCSIVVVTFIGVGTEMMMMITFKQMCKLDEG